MLFGKSKRFVARYNRVGFIVIKNGKNKVCELHNYIQKKKKQG